MSEEIREEVVRPEPAKSRSLLQRIGLYAALMLVAFLLGFIPMWLKARESGNNLASAQRTIVLAQMENNLASAAIDARKGEYEPARQAVSLFYTSLQAEINKGDDSAFTPTLITTAQGLFAGRDEIITLLARSDPASADRLADLYVAYRNIINGGRRVTASLNGVTASLKGVTASLDGAGSDAITGALRRRDRVATARL
jgi:hypothetical protein